jgi:hypothetical protein
VYLHFVPPSYPKSSQELIVKERINKSTFQQGKSTVLHDNYKPFDGILISQKPRIAPEAKYFRFVIQPASPPPQNFPVLSPKPSPKTIQQSQQSNNPNNQTIKQSNNQTIKQSNNQTIKPCLKTT